MVFLSRILMTVCVLWASMSAVPASSTIYDGVITKVNGDRIVVRVAHSPYSSVPVHSMIMTHKDGSFKAQNRSLNDFTSYFIDEIPVTREQFQKVLKPGLRMVTMENRDNWYFVTSRRV